MNIIINFRKNKTMSLFGKLKTDNLEETQDRLGGGFQPLETGLYTGKIKQAYAGQSVAAAANLTLIVDVNGREYRETIYVSNKQGENFFLNKDDKTKKVPLPGFSIVEDICQITTGIALSDQDVEDKMVKIYDYDLSKEVPKSVPVLTALLGQEITLGIGKVVENKNVKNSSGVYEPTADERVFNNIEKVFHTETKMTVVEARQGLAEGVFMGAWAERNNGLLRDKRKIKGEAGGLSGPASQKARMGIGAPRSVSSPPVAGEAAPARKSLFGAKTA